MNLSGTFHVLFIATSSNSHFSGFDKKIDSDNNSEKFDQDQVYNNPEKFDLD